MLDESVAAAVGQEEREALHKRAAHFAERDARRVRVDEQKAHVLVPDLEQAGEHSATLVAPLRALHARRVCGGEHRQSSSVSAGRFVGEQLDEFALDTLERVVVGDELERARAVLDALELEAQRERVGLDRLVEYGQLALEQRREWSGQQLLCSFCCCCCCWWWCWWCCVQLGLVVDELEPFGHVVLVGVQVLHVVAGEVEASGRLALQLALDLQVEPHLVGQRALRCCCWWHLWWRSLFGGRRRLE